MKPELTLTITHPKTLLVGVATPYNQIKNMQSYFDEFTNLVASNNITYDELFLTRIRTIDSAYFLTKGKLQEVANLCKDLEIEEVIFSEPLSAQQERNLSELFEARVFDRTQLILEIFEKGAQSAEGKLQVQLALLHHQKSRLAGRGIHMSQQAGRIGSRGPGETAKEQEKQNIDIRILRLKKQLTQLEKTRATQRKRRLDTRVPQICLIGYTNAGKSTIINALTKSDVLAEDKLFATLDTTTRELILDGKKKAVISDTVGFIQQLPHRLVEAFKSTLQELEHAHLLLQIIDYSDPNWESHIKVVMEILAELEVDKPMLYVFNKADQLDDPESHDYELRKYEPHVLISATSKKGIVPLVNYLKSWNPEA